MRIYLKDGSFRDFINDDFDDFRELVDEYLGSDAANMFVDICRAFEQFEQSEDEDDYPENNREAEYWRGELVDVKNRLDEILEAKRLDRKKLIDLCADIYTIL